jgi:hypothetical protein
MHLFWDMTHVTWRSWTNVSQDLDATIFMKGN